MQEPIGLRIIDNARIAVDEEMAAQPKKSKGKNKARRQLWDSLLDVYAEEAHKGNLADCEEVQIIKIDKWIEKHRKGDRRGHVTLAKTNPELIITADPGDIHFESGEKLSQPVKKKSKTILSGHTSTRLSHKSSKCIKNKDSCTISLKSKKTVKRRKPDHNNKFTKDVSKSSVLIIKSIDENCMDVGYNAPHKNYECISKHECKVTLRYYNENKNHFNRADGRVFNCRLVLKVAQCCESDEVF